MAMQLWKYKMKNTRTHIGVAPGPEKVGVSHQPFQHSVNYQTSAYTIQVSHEHHHMASVRNGTYGDRRGKVYGGP